MNLIFRVLVNALALGAAAYFVPGIRAGSVTSVLLIALVFGVLNAVMLMLTAWLGQMFGIDFRVDGFWPAFLGALVVSIVSVVLSWVLIDEKR